MADTRITDNHSTDQNNNDDDETSVTDNSIEETTDNCMRKNGPVNREKISLDSFLAYGKLPDTASHLSSGVKRRTRFAFLHRHQ